MPTRSVVLPVIPGAPAEYNRQYMGEIVRTLMLLSQQLQNPGEVVASALTLTIDGAMIPSTDMGLANGAVFQVNGALFTSLKWKPHINGQIATASTGSVTVTLP